MLHLKTNRIVKSLHAHQIKIHLYSVQNKASQTEHKFENRNA